MRTVLDILDPEDSAAQLLAPVEIPPPAWRAAALPTGQARTLGELSVQDLEAMAGARAETPAGVRFCSQAWSLLKAVYHAIGARAPEPEPMPEPPPSGRFMAAEERPAASRPKLVLGSSKRGGKVLQG